jgi:hypothetical protein
MLGGGILLGGSTGAALGGKLAGIPGAVLGGVAGAGLGGVGGWKGSDMLLGKDLKEKEKKANEPGFVDIASLLTALGAMTGASYGALPGLGYGAAKDRPIAGALRGALRGSMTGGGITGGGLAGAYAGTRLAGAPGALIGGLAGAGLGGVGGWKGTDLMIGKDLKAKEKEAACRDLRRLLTKKAEVRECLIKSAGPISRLASPIRSLFGGIARGTKATPGLLWRNRGKVGLGTAGAGAVGATGYNLHEAAKDQTDWSTFNLFTWGKRPDASQVFQRNKVMFDAAKKPIHDEAMRRLGNNDFAGYQERINKLRTGDFRTNAWYNPRLGGLNPFAARSGKDYMDIMRKQQTAMQSALAEEKAKFGPQPDDANILQALKTEMESPELLPHEAEMLQARIAGIEKRRGQPAGYESPKYANMLNQMRGVGMRVPPAAAASPAPAAAASPALAAAAKPASQVESPWGLASQPSPQQMMMQLKQQQEMLMQLQSQLRAQMQPRW